MINSEQEFILNYTASYPESTSPAFTIKPFERVKKETPVNSFKDSKEVDKNTTSTNAEAPVDDSSTGLMTFLVSILVLIAVIVGAGIGIHQLHKKYQILNGKIVKREVPL